MRQKRKNRKKQSKAKKEEDIPTEVLSQEEIDQLLLAINAGEDEPNDFRPAADTRKIKIYDFKRPDKFSKDQIRTMSIIHETLARLTTTSLSSQIRKIAHIHVASVDQLTYEEFIRSIPAPTTLAIIDMNPLKGNAVLEIDPAITFSIIDCLLGGTGEGIKAQHELTDIEISIMEAVIVRVLGNIREAWTQAIDLRPRLSQIDTNPQFVQIAPPTEMVILVTLEARIGNVEGIINIAHPYLLLSEIMDKLTATYWYGNVSPLHKSYKLISREDIPVAMTAEILRRDYSIKEINEWKIETVILPLRPLTPNYCYLRFGDRRVWRCEILEDRKWFPKQIKLLHITELPFRTEGKMEMTNINPVVANALSMAGITISVELGATSKPVKEILAMGEGTIVELDRMAGEPVDIKANGVLIAKGEVVVIDENFGVRIVEIVGDIRNFGKTEEKSTGLENE